MKTDTVSPVEILRDYDREMPVKTRAMLADEIERLNTRLAVALWEIECLKLENVSLTKRLEIG